MVSGGLEKMIRRTANRIAQLTRGKAYAVDPRVPMSAVMGLAFRRVIALMRCVMRGIVISADVRKLVYVGAGVEIRNRRFVRFGKGVTLGKGVVIDGLSVSGVTLGDGVSIGAYSLLQASGTVTNIGKGITIGSNSGMGEFSYIGASGGVSIGTNVIMGQRASFHAQNHVYDRLDVPIRLQGVTRKGIVIEDDCWVGANVTFLDGAHVGKGCVIAAGSVVRSSIPDYSVVAGVPGRVIRSRKEHDQA